MLAAQENASRADRDENATKENAAREQASKESAEAAGAAEQHGHAASEEQAVAATREQWLQALRDEHPALAELHNQAMERVLEQANDLGNMRGQLFEELSHGVLKARAEAMGEDHEFIAGGRIHWRGGEELTDGMIVRPSNDEASIREVAAFAECKAGARAAQGLEESNTRFERLGQEQRNELERVAIDELRQRLGATQEDRQPGNWAHADQLRENHRQDLDALMGELHGPDRTGQLRNDFERLMEHATSADVEQNVRAREAVTVLIDGEEARVMASPAETKVFAVTPSDVNTDQMLERLEKQGIQAESVQLAFTTAEVETLARELQEAQREYEKAAGEARSKDGARNAEAARDAARESAEPHARDTEQAADREHQAPHPQQMAHGAQLDHNEEMRQARERDRLRLDELANFADALRDADDY
jgi:hypothetical protein